MLTFSAQKSFQATLKHIFLIRGNIYSWIRVYTFEELEGYMALETHMTNKIRPILLGMREELHWHDIIYLSEYYIASIMVHDQTIKSVTSLLLLKSTDLRQFKFWDQPVPDVQYAFYCSFL